MGMHGFPPHASVQGLDVWCHLCCTTECPVFTNTSICEDCETVMEVHMKEVSEIPAGARRVGIVGSRRRASQRDKVMVLDIVREELARGLPVVLVSGGCKKGADRFAEIASERLDTPIRVFRPEPGASSYGEAVRRLHARNKLIAENCDVLYALVSEDRTGGTENTIQHAEKLGVKIVVK